MVSGALSCWPFPADSVQTTDSCHGGSVPSLLLPSISHTHQLNRQAEISYLTLPPAAYALHTLSCGLMHASTGKPSAT